MAEHITFASVRKARHPLPIHFILLAVFVSVGAFGAIELSIATGRVAALWVSNAFLLAVLLRFPRRDWIALLAVGGVANVSADLLCGDSVATAIVLTLCNVAEVLVVALPLRVFRIHRDFTRPRSLVAFYALAAGPAPMLSGAMAAAYFHWQSGQDFLVSAVNWYSSDSIGLVTIVPLMMTVRLAVIGSMFRRDELTTTLLAFFGVAAAIGINLYAREYPFAFLFFPAVLLVTFVRGFEGGAMGLGIVAAYLLIPVLMHAPVGSMRERSPREQLLIVQVFLATIGFMVVLVGAALEERRRLERGLAEAITRAESAREEAILAKDAAENANRMKSTFLATMSHELRTPLNAVIGFSGVMTNEMYGPLGDKRYKEYVSLIRGAGTHLLELINDILDMSKIEAGKHELVCERLDGRAVIRDCLNLMRESAERASVDLVEDVPQHPLWVEADPRALKQILINLLSNAVKFTPSGGRVTARATASGERMVLSVIDTGLGIPADQIYRLGNPFVQLRSNAGSTHAGTGLGLALVRALAEMHDGGFRIESVEQEGTTVTVEIPLHRPAALAA